MSRPRKKTRARIERPVSTATVADAIDQVEHAKHRARTLMALVQLLDEFAGRDPQRKVLVGSLVPVRADVLAEIRSELVLGASIAKQQYLRTLGTPIGSR